MYPLLTCTLHLCLQVTFTVTALQTNCRQCKPGYYVSRQCTISHDTVCKPCPPGTFSPEYNLSEQCLTCSKCNVGEYALKACTKLGDTVCAPCPDISDIVDNNFSKECLQNQHDDSLTSHFVNPSDILLQDGNVDDSYESSGVSVTNTLYEGSGVVESEVETVDVWPTVEGSGETPEEETKDNVTYVIIPEGIDSGVTEKTTVRTDVIDVDSGIQLPDPTDKTATDVVISSSAPKVILTTLRTIILEGDGVELPDTNGKRIHWCGSV